MTSHWISRVGVLLATTWTGGQAAAQIATHGAQGQPEPRAIIDRAIEMMGGHDAFAEVRSAGYSVTASTDAGEIVMQVGMILPRNVVVRVDDPMITMTLVDDVAWMTNSTNTTPMRPTEHGQITRMNPLGILLRLPEHAEHIAGASAVEYEGGIGWKIQLEPDYSSAALIFDGVDGLLRAVEETEGPDLPPLTTRFTRYERFDTLTLPSRTTIRAGGEALMSLAIADVRFNAVRDANFIIPPEIAAAVATSPTMQPSPDSSLKVGAPAATKPAAPLPSAPELVDRLVAAMGGRSALDAIESVEYTLQVVGPGGESTVHVRIAPPDRLVAVLQTPMGEMEVGRVGDVGWMADPTMGRLAMPKSQMSRLNDIDVLGSLLRIADGTEVIEVVDHASFDGRACTKTRLPQRADRDSFAFFDVETGLLHATEETVKTPMGPMPLTLVYLDYQPVASIKMFRKAEVRSGPTQGAMNVSKITLNTVPLDVFEIPDEITRPSAPNDVPATRPGASGAP